jgi:hypothetical protein
MPASTGCDHAKQWRARKRSQEQDRVVSVGGVGGEREPAHQWDQLGRRKL